MKSSEAIDQVLTRVADMADEMVAFAADLIRIPTVNPPGEHYRECAELIGDRLDAIGMDVEYFEAAERPEHTTDHPRVNVVGALPGQGPRPCIHLNGHFDVVPAGEGWTVDPFGGVVQDGRLFGRGSADMKAGLAAAVYAVAAIRRSGVQLAGSVDVSGTVDEESGGFAGVAHLAEIGRVSSETTDFAIIPEPFSPHRICVGHRGVYWFRVTASGKIAHGCMPFLGQNAIQGMGTFLEAVRSELAPRLDQRLTSMPVVPPEARNASININSVIGGQAGEDPQTPCVAELCEAVFDRRFLPEEDFSSVRGEIAELLESVAGGGGSDFAVEELMVVHPTRAPQGSPLVQALQSSIEVVVGRKAELVASPGTYDQKHFARIGGVEHCVAYGPGTLEQAHQADESCSVDDIVKSAQVMARTILELVGPEG